jgi:hypothetical protein
MVNESSPALALQAGLDHQAPVSVFAQPGRAA